VFFFFFLNLQHYLKKNFFQNVKEYIFSELILNFIRKI